MVVVVVVVVVLAVFDIIEVFGFFDKSRWFQNWKKHF